MKIDLQEINGIIADIMLDYDEAVMNNEDLTAKSWGYETGQIFSHEKAKKIADALEQLPKLIETLRAADKTFDYLRSVTGGDSESAQLVKQALEHFTTNPQP